VFGVFLFTPQTSVLEIQDFLEGKKGTYVKYKGVDIETTENNNNYWLIFIDDKG
jgi:hypothetical protein